MIWVSSSRAVPSLKKPKLLNGELAPDAKVTEVAELTKDIMVLFKSIHMKGATVVVATHSRELLEDTEQGKIFLNGGKISGEE